MPMPCMPWLSQNLSWEKPKTLFKNLNQALLVAPESLSIAVTLAQAKLQQKDPKGAEEVLKQAVKKLSKIS